MTIEREHHNGPYVIQCDNCGEAEELLGTGFHSAVEDAQERGFVMKLVDDIWQHFCGYCGKQHG